MLTFSRFQLRALKLLVSNASRSVTRNDCPLRSIIRKLARPVLESCCIARIAGPVVVCVITTSFMTAFERVETMFFACSSDKVADRDRGVDAAVAESGRFVLFTSV